MKLNRPTGLRAIALVAATWLGLAGAQAQEVTIGVPAAATGIFSFAGVPGNNGIKAALENINASGELGKVKLKLLFEDTASDKNQATTVVSRFASNKDVALILGPTSSVESFAALPVAQQNRVPVLTTALGDVQSVGDWIFKSSATPVDIMRSLAVSSLERIKPQRVAYVFNRDNDAYIAQKNAVKAVYERAGVTTVAEETIVGGDADFTALATKLTNLNIDTLLISTTAEVSANIIIQARQAGLSPKIRILGSSAMGSQQFIKVGGKAVEGVIFASDYFLGNEHPANKAFVDTYKRLFKVEPDVFAFFGYNQLVIAAAAIKAAGPTYNRDAIRTALAAVKDLPSITRNGAVTITPQRTPAYEGFVITVRNGDFVLY